MLAKVAKALGLPPSDIVHHQWVDNGPGWCAVMLRSARDVLALAPNWPALAPLKLGVVGPHDAAHDAAFEVRAFIGATSLAYLSLEGLTEATTRPGSTLCRACLTREYPTRIPDERRLAKLRFEPARA